MRSLRAPWWDRQRRAFGCRGRPGIGSSRPFFRFAPANHSLYVSTDTNNPLTATLEGATYAPGLEDITGGGDDSLFSPVERIFVFVNGQTGSDNPQRQGLNSALSDGGSPLNVLGGIPTVATDYSPIWDINPLGRKGRSNSAIDPA
jgi:hypothetical protein